MEKLKLIRKLNNESGKSIFMALFLLLVCVVVSVVIVTVAITSIMHVDSNKISNQEYLACSSAAGLIKDSLAGSVYEKIDMKWVANDYSTSNKDEEVEETTKNDWKTTSETPSNMKPFAKKIVDAILNDSATLPTGSFTINVNDVDGVGSVTVDYKLVIATTPSSGSGSSGTSNTETTSYSLKFKLESKYNDKSDGYRMSMVIPIDKNIDGPNGDGKESSPCLKEAHYKWDGNLRTHNYSKYKTTTTITWQNAKGTGISITRGWDAYEK